MASMMAIGSEVFGRCAWEILVTLEPRNIEILIFCEMKHLRLVLAGKAAQYPGSQLATTLADGGHFNALGVIEEKPLWVRGALAF
jgi:hypothetical protein